MKPKGCKLPARKCFKLLSDSFKSIREVFFTGLGYFARKIGAFLKELNSASHPVKFKMACVTLIYDETKSKQRQQTKNEYQPFPSELLY